MNLKKLLPLLLVFALIGAAVGYYMYNKPHRDIASEAAAFQISASALFDEYEANENTANEKYLDKVVEVSGTLEEVATNDKGELTAIMTAENAMMGGLNLTFKEKAEINSGDEIKAKCRCTGMLMDVVLVECSLVKE